MICTALRADITVVEELYKISSSSYYYCLLFFLCCCAGFVERFCIRHNVSLNNHPIHTDIHRNVHNINVLFRVPSSCVSLSTVTVFLCEFCSRQWHGIFRNNYSVITIIIDRFCVELRSALEQTHCAHLAWDSDCKVSKLGA